MKWHIKCLYVINYHELLFYKITQGNNN